MMDAERLLSLSRRTFIKGAAGSFAGAVMASGAVA